MSSTFISNSGREYVRDAVLKPNTTRPELSLCVAYCEIQTFVLKSTSASVYQMLQKLKCEFESIRFRHHIDANDNERVLVYEWYENDLFQLITKHPNITITSRKWMLREIGEALKEMHAKEWIDIDVKPDNVFVNWRLDGQGLVTIEKVALGDLDCALQLKDNRPLRIRNRGRTGNVMWSSPEQLTGQGIAKPSDVFAFGLMCIFVITKQVMFHPDFEEIDNNAGYHAEALMALLAAYFGAFPRELLTHINDEVWIATMEEYSKACEVMGQEPRFINWPQTDFPDLDACTKAFISRMMEHDPAKRATMEELMSDPWWSK